VTPYKGEYLRYRALLNGALDQVSQADFDHAPSGSSNSISVILKHLAGNLKSRFTNFLTEDGEKPWRNLEDEFSTRDLTSQEIRSQFNDALELVLNTLDSLNEEDRKTVVTIRDQELSVDEALARSLAHFSFHVGEIVYLCKIMANNNWTSLSIPVGKSVEYNQNPDKERLV
jgi:uncharacterized damage-inducible protein DinB